MADWNSTPGSGGDTWGTGNANDFGGGTSVANDLSSVDPSAGCSGCGQTDHAIFACPNAGNDDGAADGGDDKCFGCGEAGHRRADCPTASEMTCRYCSQVGHMVRDCPDKPPMVCENCGEEGHMRRACENARKIDRSHVDTVSGEDAWSKIVQGVAERDVDDVKEGVQEYVKAMDGAITYKELQQALIDQNINLWLISTEREIINIFTNMDLQGNMGKKYSISYRFSKVPERPREIDGWPESQEEILARLDDAGEIVNSGQMKCYRCGELGHTSKECSEEVTERPAKAPCHNCGTEGHRVRDCPEPRVDKFACKNCGKSGHKVAECEEPPNLDNVECRKCNQMGHFSKDCPQGGGSGCRNCGQEGHISKECTEPKNMDNVTCRNCEKTGHFSRECPEPRDWSKVQCSNCQQYGHTKVRCKEPVADEGGFDAGGGGSGAGFDNPAPAEPAFNTGGNDNWGSTAPAVEVSSGGW